jgi:2-keto-4-pentenoate hydratase/2-oxohepta-3-ene-1,7-dioic acid hydratase in catechol pathway
LKLASFTVDGEDRFGVLVNDRLLDLSDTAGNPGHQPRSTLELIEAGAAGLDWVRHVASRPLSQVTNYSIEEIRWCAPVLRPSKICCVALNNSANADRILRGPKHPAVFIKPASSLIGHNDAIECRAEYGRTHPEPELAVVIGRMAKNVSASDAYDYVFGYTIHNDITSPTMRGEDTFHYRAIHPKAGDARKIEYVETWVSYPGRYKCSDTFACMGPWLVTRDEIPDPHNLRVTCSHKGEVITDDNTVNLFYKTPELLEFISRYMTLLPGDIISVGTALKQSVSGGAVQNIDLNRFGGPVSVSIEHIGTLTNEVRHLT